MGSDDKGKTAQETIADEAKGLALEVYRDGAKPAVGVVGDTLGAIAKLVLWPVRKIVDRANEGLERLSARVEKKLEDVPKDRIQPPPATIAAPAALHYALLGEGDEVTELREMFENLLVTSMDRGTAANAHPAFVGMISQMTPDEAWILKSITAPLAGIPIFQVLHEDRSPDRASGGGFSWEASCAISALGSASTSPGRHSTSRTWSASASSPSTGAGTSGATSTRSLRSGCAVKLLH